MDNKTPLYNPLDDSFSYKWYDDFHKPHLLSMPAGKVSYFSPSQAKFMTKHLTDAIIEQRKINPILVNEREKIIHEITDITL